MKLFHKGLYKEGLRQSSLIGIIFTSIMLLAAVFTPLLQVSSSVDGNTGKQIIIGMEFNRLFLLTFTAYIPLMALALFSFLNRRNRSDFYHSMPHRRETVFGSYSISILTWVFSSMALCSLLTFIIYLFGANVIDMNYSSIFIYIFNMAAACIMVLGATLLAMTLTGTVFSNIVTALLIIFLPRTLTTFFTSAVGSMTIIAPGEVFGILGEGGYNIPFGFVSALFSNTGIDFLTDYKSGIYTIVLGIIYFVVAGASFKARKSETAGTSAPNAKVQTVIRVALCFFFCAIACLPLLDPNSGSFMGPVIIFCVAIIVYFAYELVTTRKLKSIVKSLPGLLIVLLLNAVFIGGAYIAKNVQLSVNWNAEDISYVSVQPFYAQRPSYEELRLAEVEIDNPKALSSVSDILSGIQEEIKQDASAFDRARRNDWYSLNMRIKMKNGKEYIREVIFTKNENKEWESLMLSSGLYEGAWGSLPEEPSSMQYSVGGLTQEQNEAIYECFKQEVEEIDLAEWIKQNTGKMIQSKTVSIEDDMSVTTFVNRNVLFELFISGIYGFKKYDSTYSITELTPKTLAMITGFVNENGGTEMDRFWNEFKENGNIFESGDYIDVHFEAFSITSEGERLEAYANFNAYEENRAGYDSFKPAAELLDKKINEQKGKEADLSEGVCKIIFTKKSYDESGKNFYYGESFTYIVGADEQIINAINDIYLSR